MQRITQALSLLLIGLFSAAAVAQETGLNEGILELQHAWEHVHYQIPKDQQDAAFPHVEDMADALIARYPGRAEPLVWKAIVLGTHAGTKGGLGALRMVREARDLLEQAEKIDPDTLNGSIYTTLGSLYYQVPGWPLGYGNDKKAEIFLKKALAINPTGIDPNYFYGDFLYRKSHYHEALSYLERAMHAPPRPNRPLADQGRREEIRVIIARIQDKTKESL
jgi:tetratricopeptide (TPR) repeat protein